MLVILHILQFFSLATCFSIPKINFQQEKIYFNLELIGNISRAYFVKILCNFKTYDCSTKLSLRNNLEHKRNLILSSAVDLQNDGTIHAREKPETKKIAKIKQRNTYKNLLLIMKILLHILI